MFGRKCSITLTGGFLPCRCKTHAAPGRAVIAALWRIFRCGSLAPPRISSPTAPWHPKAGPQGHLPLWGSCGLQLPLMLVRLCLFKVGLSVVSSKGAKWPLLAFPIHMLLVRRMRAPRMGGMRRDKAQAQGPTQAYKGGREKVEGPWLMQVLVSGIFSKFVGTVFTSIYFKAQNCNIHVAA
jgi:hypothetical protein